MESVDGLAWPERSTEIQSERIGEVKGWRLAWLVPSNAFKKQRDVGM